jgi:hypothetical protein
MRHRVCSPAKAILSGWSVCLTGWVLFFLTGCVYHPVELSYPIGLYGVRRTNDFPEISQAGFNLVCGPAERGYLQAAQRCDLKVLATPGTQAGLRFDEQAARRAVLAFDPHPSLWAWYLVDEPDLNGIAPELVSKANRFLKSVPARKPTALTLSSAFAAPHYADIPDIAMIDRYPISWLPLANFGQHVRLTRLAAGKTKPLLAVIQAFDWSYYPELLPGETNQRPPTFLELRCMTYLALALRANGLFYYAFDDGRWKMSDHPKTWEALRKVVAEVHRHRALFAAAHVWRPYRHQFADWPHRFNAALESSITPAFLRVTGNDQGVPAGDYLLAVNNTDRSVDYQIYLPELQDGTVPVLGETRRLQPSQKCLEDHFNPFEVHIYGPLNFADTRIARIRGNR